MTDEQRKRFDEFLIAEARRNDGLTITDIFMLKEVFWSCEIERQTDVIEKEDTKCS